ncbi:Stress responsive alpha-beta barrel domain-containing protein [Evansella cellulosilytica DSM 2522]|uniref:Stress responsive alpha-beta barrel domain-containing protein n=2 Tax=Evansella TaxID=2837485 RepID=E6TZ66_EVAC2|nr:Stress responsive alpha-beta barrel domain-containing protein [Evansella cellulosilytica DSM 2522]
MKQGTIKHMAFFTLKHPLDAKETEVFLKDGRDILSNIDVVENFEVLRQISPKTNFDFGFSMEFKNQDDYDTYNNHPNHVAFVNDRWLVEVERFQEIDYVLYK